MTLFQLLALTGLGALFTAETIAFWRDRGVHPLRWLRALVWLSAAVAIAAPGLVQSVADTVGVGRGTDLVFYLFVLLFLGVTFHFYARFVRLQRQVTQLVRHLAIQEARQGDAH
jgi:hypothetical protein